MPKLETVGEGKFFVTIAWGSDRTSRKRYRFQTRVELKAFLAGVEEGTGWLDFEVMAGGLADTFPVREKTR